MLDEIYVQKVNLILCYFKKSDISRISRKYVKLPLR